ncbi:MAG: ferritin-like domain-containing protein [Rhodospirillales bacterium]|nr:ferritin-like domain-containing protein [Rhodospirillales bacterium]MCW8863191.1 ferritin-like domain-containing protein [Rhodospirillales bacterium]MCW8952200.1 ferritin-like domain-containing protein [Rhodospirillales bacterium]MCW8970622.1 ferritin-like domain-containing protein [Rhodospirillales bacterium]MCW9001120.1 ferritin-like domain-containing protein [Rhodospirillales bacterium]
MFDKDCIPATLTDAARSVLLAPEPNDKVRLTHLYAQAWREGRIDQVGAPGAPDRPARPSRPELRPPREMPRRGAGGNDTKVALLHAIAHIELNAVDLAWDVIARFADPSLPRDFCDDWVQVAVDEAEHFEILNERMAELNSAYGDLPAHDGLWEAAQKTAHDLMARMALVPMTLEARGLDTTPATVARLRRQNDERTAAIMERIGEEEIAHVAAGRRWFEYMAEKRNVDAVSAYHTFIREHYKSALKRPFNAEARDRAGMKHEYYEPLAAE